MVTKRNKPLTVVLLISVAFIWSVILFKVYSSLSGGKGQTPVSHNQTISTVAEDTLVSYAVQGSSRDPFLSILTDTAAELVPDTPLRRPVIASAFSVKPTLPQYFGLVQFERSKTAIIKWKNRIENVQEGSMLDSMRIKSINDTQIVVIIRTSKYTIGLSNMVRKSNGVERE